MGFHGGCAHNTFHGCTSQAFSPRASYRIELTSRVKKQVRVETHNSSNLVQIRVVDLGQEAHLGRGHGILFGQKELELELAACFPRPL
jgi:hypothetical protein